MGEGEGGKGETNRMTTTTTAAVMMASGRKMWMELEEVKSDRLID